jgi:hypothetical protein
MKKIISICIGFILFLWTVMFLASCTPVRYVYIDPKDSVVRKQRVIVDYDFTPFNFYTPLPFYFGRPFYNPVIIQRQRPIIIPQRPYYRPTTPRPYYRPAPSRPPLQRPITPWRSPRN